MLAALKSLVEKYGLTVSEKYQSTFDELLAAGTEAQNKSERDDAINKLFENVEWEKTDSGYGLFMYSTILENTTDFNFKDVSVMLALYDSEDVRSGETYASIRSWEKGEKAKFEATTNIDATRIKTNVDRYSVDE